MSERLDPGEVFDKKESGQGARGCRLQGREKGNIRDQEQFSENDGKGRCPAKGCPFSQQKDRKTSHQGEENQKCQNRVASQVKPFRKIISEISC